VTIQLTSLEMGYDPLLIALGAIPAQKNKGGEKWASSRRVGGAGWKISISTVFRPKEQPKNEARLETEGTRNKKS